MYFLLTSFSFFRVIFKVFCTVYSVKDISQLYFSSNLQRCWLCEPLEINPGNVVGQKHKRNQWADTPLPYLSISIFYQEKYRCKLFLIQRKHWQVRWVEKNSKLLGCSRLSWIPAARSKVTWETAALEEIHIPRISNYTGTGFRVTHTRDLWFPFFFGFRDSFRNRDRSAFSALFNHNVRLMSVFITKWVIWYFLHGHVLNLCCNCFKTQPMNE